jgi:ABC-type sulfate transport system permease component
LCLLLALLMLLQWCRAWQSCWRCAGSPSLFNINSITLYLAAAAAVVSGMEQLLEVHKGLRITLQPSKSQY